MFFAPNNYRGKAREVGRSYLYVPFSLHFVRPFLKVGSVGLLFKKVKQYPIPCDNQSKGY